MADTVIQFSKPEVRRSPRSPGDTFDISANEPNLTSTPVRKSAARASGGSTTAPIEIDKLYPPSEGPKPNLIRVLGLIADAIVLLDEARVAAQHDEAINADRDLQRFQLMLPKLFAYRSIGDGYAALINSLHFAFINLHGKPLTLEQITTIWRILRELRTRPFLSFDQAVEYVGEMESVSFEVDPSTLAEMLEEADDE